MTSAPPHDTPSHDSPPPDHDAAITATDHDAVTLALAKKESAQHLRGIDEVYQSMRRKPLIIQAHPYGQPIHTNTKTNNDTNTNTTTKVKVVHFVRHGQGFHNLMADMYASRGMEWEQFVPSPSNPYVMTEITDAPLTQKGRNQAKLLIPIVKAMEIPPQLIVSSTNCRAIQTGLIAFGHLLKQRNVPSVLRPVPVPVPVPFVAHELVREETGVHVCDQRRTKSEQELEFPQVNFDLITSENDALFRTDRRETKLEIGQRVYDFMEWLEEREETHVAVASHSGWLQTAFNGIFECSEDSLKAWFQTGELRSVTLVFTRRSSATTSS